MILKFQSLVLGTWSINNKDVVQVVNDKVASVTGILIQPQAYGNGSGIGEGIRACDVNRKDLFEPQNLPSK